jgi:ligand-binding sensor domain-containing protein
MMINYKILFATITWPLIVSCRNKLAEIPLPVEESGFFKPIAQAIHFTVPDKIKWPGKVIHIKPLLKKFDFNKLPVSVYDSTDFIPFSKPPEKVHFNLDSLPKKAFIYNNLPTRHLKFETFILDQPKLIKVGHPHLVNSGLGLIYEFGEPFVNNHVSCLFKDRMGFLWIATEQGLYRYDGENLALIILGSIVPNVYGMLEDKYGKIWIGTQGNGIIVLDKRADTFKHLGAEQGLASNDVARILIDNTGRIWVTESSRAAGEGVDIIDQDSFTIKHIGTAQGLSTNFTTGIIQDNRNNIWIGNLKDGGVNIIDLKNDKIKYLDGADGLNTNSVTGLLLDKESRIWISSLHGEVNSVDIQHETITHYYTDQDLKRDMIWSLMDDSKGHIWMGTYENGVEIIDPLKGTLKIVRKIDGMSANSIEWITEDHLRQIWVASFSGLNMFNKNGANIEHLGKLEIRNLVEDSQGYIWICTNNEGVQILDTATGLIRSITTRQGLGTDNPLNIFEKKGEILISGNRGLDIIDSSRKNLKHIGKYEGLTYDPIRIVFEDGQRKIWIGNNLGIPGVDLLDEKQGTVQHLDVEQGLEQSFIFDITQDSLGLIWIAYSSGAINIIDPINKTIQYLTKAKDLIQQSILALLPDDKGNMWIGTSRGIYIVNSSRDSLMKLSTEEGLLSNDIISLNQFAGCIYAGTRAGLSVITPSFSPSSKNWQIESFGSAEGFRKLDVGFASNYITRKGKFLWGDLGITILNDRNKAKTVSPIYITSIDIFNQPQHFTGKPWHYIGAKDTLWSPQKDTFYLKGQSLSNALHSVPNNALWDSVTIPFNIPVHLRLPYEDNYLQFHFTQIHLGSQNTVQYRYILEGIDKKWNDITYNTFSQNYQNLQPGDYNFKVSAKGRNGEWMLPAVCSFTIIPPWWQTWWFYMFCCIGIVGSLYSLYRYRINQILKVQAIRNRIAADLHDDIGSTLSSISIMSELAKDNSTGSVSLLNAIGESASAIQENMSDLVWAVNPNNDRFKNIVERMNQFATEILEAKSIAFHFTCDEDIYDERLSMDQRKKVYLFFKEAINNAAKYSGAKCVDVHISSLNSQIILKIADNGHGFNLNEESHGNGLINFKRRADELGGRLSIHSAINEGTTIELSFKIT